MCVYLHIDWVLDARRVPALVGPVRYEVGNARSSEGFGVDICTEVVHRAIEACVFSAFVPCCEDVLRNGVFLFIVYDLDKVALG